MIGLCYIISHRIRIYGRLMLTNLFFFLMVNVDQLIYTIRIRILCDAVWKPTDITRDATILFKTAMIHMAWQNGRGNLSHLGGSDRCFTGSIASLPILSPIHTKHPLTKPWFSREFPHCWDHVGGV